MKSTDTLECREGLEYTFGETAKDEGGKSVRNHDKILFMPC